MTARAPKFSKLNGCLWSTVPGGVRNQSGPGGGDWTRQCTEPGGPVHIESDLASAEDLSLAAFLGIIETDMQAFPECVQPFDCGLHDRLKALVGDVEVDLDGPLSPDE